MAKIRNYILIFDDCNNIWLQIGGTFVKKYSVAEKAAFDLACFYNGCEIEEKGVFLNPQQICNWITLGMAEVITHYNLHSHKSKKPLFNSFKEHLELKLKSFETQSKN